MVHVFCIDLALTNDVHCIENVIVDEPICSWHSPVTIHLSFKTPKQKAYKRVIKNYNLANYQGLNADLTLVNWDEDEFNTENINDIYNNFTEKYSKLI